MINFKFYSLTLLIIFIFHSCQNNVVNNSIPIQILNDGNTENTNPFLNEISKLKEIHFPINLHCEIIVDSFKFIDKNNNSFFDEGEFLVSKYEYLNFVSILSYYVGDYNYPYYKTYTYSGKQIDSTYLFNGNCGEDEYSKTEVYAILNPYYIIQSDTSTYYNLKNEIIDSITISESTIKIDSLGRFIKLN
jgi:hypothetical protein